MDTVAGTALSPTPILEPTASPGLLHPNLATAAGTEHLLNSHLSFLQHTHTHTPLAFPPQVSSGAVPPVPPIGAAQSAMGTAVVPDPATTSAGVACGAAYLPGGMAQTMHLLEARAQGSASMAALSAHAAQLEQQLRSQQALTVRSEAARTDALAQQAALAHDVASLSQERTRLAAQLDHYIQRSDELVAERGAGSTQIAELTRERAQDTARSRADLGVMQGVTAALEAECERLRSEKAALEVQSESMYADLREVTSLIDQLEGEPGFVASSLRRRPHSPAASRSAAAAEGRLAAARAALAAREVDARVLRSSLAESEHESGGGGGGGRSRGGGAMAREHAEATAEVARLREENSTLEAQIEMLSEKMYGSPAKSAARERDRLQMQLEQERGARLHAEDYAADLEVQLGAAREQIQQLQDHHHAGEATRRDLERTRRMLHAAQTNAALGLMDGGAGAPRAHLAQQHHPSVVPARSYNPIAAPRHQFGDASRYSHGSGGGALRTTPSRGIARSSTPKTAGPSRYL